MNSCYFSNVYILCWLLKTEIKTRDNHSILSGEDEELMENVDRGRSKMPQPNQHRARSTSAPNVSINMIQHIGGAGRDLKVIFCEDY